MSYFKTTTTNWKELSAVFRMLVFKNMNVVYGALRSIHFHWLGLEHKTLDWLQKFSEHWNSFLDGYSFVKIHPLQRFSLWENGPSSETNLQTSVIYGHGDCFSTKVQVGRLRNLMLGRLYLQTVTLTCYLGSNLKITAKADDYTKLYLVHWACYQCSSGIVELHQYQLR